MHSSRWTFGVAYVVTTMEYGSMDYDRVGMQRWITITMFQPGQRCCWREILLYNIIHTICLINAMQCGYRLFIALMDAWIDKIHGCTPSPVGMEKKQKSQKNWAELHPAIVHRVNNSMSVG